MFRAVFLVLSALAVTVSSASITASVALVNSVFTKSNGDLWPNCWSDDNNVYGANGDGTGFGSTESDIVVSRISGSPPSLSGTVLAEGNSVGTNYEGTNFTRKPTGMLCRNSTIYLAFQNLRLDFNEVPVASISVSHDYGSTWSWDTKKPMFNNFTFTTIWFLDYGKDSWLAPEDWVYVYGLDGNWRASYDNAVPSPTQLFLARVPPSEVQNRSAYEWYSSTSSSKPCWSCNIAEKQPVLTDTRLLYPCAANQSTGTTVGVCNLTVVSQGGVIYNKPLDTYIYTSWTEFTYEFYKAPQPWGPWKLFYQHDFGKYPWSNTSYGGYATTIPSKYVSNDGKSMLLQSNVCPCANAGVTEYSFNLRNMTLSD